MKAYFIPLFKHISSNYLSAIVSFLKEKRFFNCLLEELYYAQTLLSSPLKKKELSRE
jgi:hypothetical protein